MKRVAMLLLLLSFGTACPHAWGRRGTIDKALEQDMIEAYKKRNCPLDTDDWWRFCAYYDEDPEDAQDSCPEECRPNHPEP
jgi:hypothetical protein